MTDDHSPTRSGLFARLQQRLEALDAISGGTTGAVANAALDNSVRPLLDGGDLGNAQRRLSEWYDTHLLSMSPRAPDREDAQGRLRGKAMSMMAQIDVIEAYVALDMTLE
jgi:hypothetical protein